MDISFKGGNCVVISTKKDTIIVDGGLTGIGLKDVKAKDAIYLSTQPRFTPENTEQIVFDGPGDYEVKNTSIKGIAVSRMIDHNDEKNSTIFRIVTEGISIVIVGHIRVPLTEEELEKIGLVDIVVIPVGGNGYTLAAHQAVGVVAQLDPKVIIPTHYQDEAASYEVTQDGVEEFVKELGGDHEVTASYKIKNGILPPKQTVIVINRS